MTNWNKMMMDCILAEDEDEFKEKKKNYVDAAVEVMGR